MSEPAAKDLPLPPVHYPESDGEPMAETPVHAEALTYLRDALKLCFRDREDVYVAGNMFFYHEEGNPAARRAPDVFVVEGVAKTPERRVYKLWVEGVAPRLVVEVTSKSTQREDLWEKRALYEKLGVAEYLLFDPEGEYLEPRFQAYLLEAGEGYRSAELEEDGTYRSGALGVGFRPEGPLLRVLGPDGEVIPRFEEAADRAEEEARRAQEEARRAQEEARRAQELERRLAHYRERFGDLEDE